MNRVLLPIVVIASLLAIEPSHAMQSDVRLQVVPGVVCKVDDSGGSRTSSFAFDIAVICSTECELTATSGAAELFGAGHVVERQDWTTPMLARIKRTSFRIEPNTPVMAPVLAIHLPEAFELRYYFREPQAMSLGRRLDTGPWT